MIFSSKAASRGRRAAAGLALALTLGVLASCGGGTTQFEPFVAQRVFAFGDENSALTTSGQRYGINGLTETGALDCTRNQIWVQQVAALYGFVFAECNPAAVSEPKAKMYAAAGAKVADISAQVDAQVAAGGFREKDLATLLVGVNDILEVYAQFPGRDEQALLAEARARGERAAQVVNRMVNLGAKVIVSNLPDMGFSPYALAQKAAFTDTDRAALISRLTAAFNEQLGVKVLLDGRFVGLVQVDQSFQAIGRAPAAFGLANATDGACNVVLPQCTTATLVTGADAANYLWADATRMGPVGQAQLASLAGSRASRNPF